MSAVDLPIDEAEELRELARKCRMLAGGGSTPEARQCFNEMAADYERRAALREGAADRPPLPPAAAR